MIKKQKIFLILASLLLISVFIINQYTLQFFTNDCSIDSNNLLFLIWLYDLIALFIIGIIFIKKGIFNFSLKIILFFIIKLLVVVFLLELSLRLYFKLKYQFKPSEMVFNNIIGWQNTQHMYEHENYDLWGEVTYTTQKYGFRIFGNTNSEKTKIFVIGDSFTMAGNISDGKTYYEHLLVNDNIELFAYGGGGYGSLQEYLILDNYFDEIDPDIIIWQFCDNDLINNDNELEGRSLIHSGIDPRPYYIDGEIHLLLPWRRHGKIYNVLNKSYIIKILSLELKLLKQENLITIEDIIKNDDPLYLNSVNTTEEIMQLVLERIKGRPLITFNARIYNDFSQWWSNTYKNIAIKNDFIFLSEISDSLSNARNFGIKIDGSPKDEHWNQTGHEIVGKVLLDYLEKNYL